MRTLAWALVSMMVVACKGPDAETNSTGTASPISNPTATSIPTPSATPISIASETPSASAFAAPLRLGVPVTASLVKLADVAKDPAKFTGKSFATTGTVTSVCQAMGCWMEIKDADSQAHIKMSGESFFVPKTSAGHVARVQGTLVSGATPAASDEDCNDEAKKQMGHPVAKMQLVATGVELD